MALTLSSAPGALASEPEPGESGHDHDHDHVLHVHSPTAPPGVDVPQTSPYRPRVAARSTSGTTHSGTAFVPVALVDFSDNAARFPRGNLHDMLFQRGYPHGAGSFADYYADQSRGTFEITGETSPWARMPRAYSEYVGANHGMQTSGTNDWTLARDAALAADESIDFCRADKNGDGYADSFVVLHAGPGASETGAGLWPVSWSLPSPVTTKDKCSDGRVMKVKNFIVVSERHANTSLSAPGAPPGLASIGTIVHEFGHVLGLPDLYDTSYQTPGGVGQWDVMGTGSWGFGSRTPWRPTPLSAWSRLELGWARATNVADRALEESLPSVDAPGTGMFEGVYRLAPGGSMSATEYFLVERRTRNGFAAEFPRDGMLVWRVRTSGSPRVSLVQADGRDDLGRSGTSSAWADGGDLFPGNSNVREIDDGTNPSTLLSGGGTSNVAIAGIKDGGARASLFVTPPPASPPSPPVDVAAETVAGGVRIDWTPSASSDVFEYRIYRRPSGGNPVRIAAVPGDKSFAVDSAGAKEGTSYVVRAYNRLESGDSNAAAVSASTKPSDGSFAPKSIAVVLGKKLRGSAASLGAADGNALEIASRFRRKKHKVSYRIVVPVSGAPEDLVITGIVDRNLRGTVALKHDDGTWVKLGRLDASPSKPFSLAASGVGFTSKGVIEVRIKASKRRGFAHKLNAFGVVVR